MRRRFLSGLLDGVGGGWPRLGEVGATVFTILAVVVLLGAGSGWAAQTGAFDVPLGRGLTRFDYWIPSVHSGAPAAVLLLVPGYNGDGMGMLSAEWQAFAERHGVVLLAPSFRTSPQELGRREGYYYPEQGSGRAVERALAELRQRTPVRTTQIFLFGFSAGAHFAHRFARWKPEMVGAFAAGGAAWWDEPDAALRKVPAFIFCGEEDPRLSACARYFEVGVDLDLPWVWRSYRGIGHALSPGMQRTAQAFLAHYLRAERDEPSLYGDAQTYEVSREVDDIPEATRMRLPSAAFAEIWRREE